MLEAWLRAHDSLWLGKQFEELRNHFRNDVIFVPPGFATRTLGIDLAIEGYRSFVETSRIEFYETHDYHFTRNGDTVIAEYAWAIVFEGALGIAIWLCWRLSQFIGSI